MPCSRPTSASTSVCLPSGRSVVTVWLRRSTTCAGTPARLPDPRNPLAPCHWAAARVSPRSLAGAAPDPSPTSPGQGDGELRGQRRRTSQISDATDQRRAPRHAGSCSSDSRCRHRASLSGRPRGVLGVVVRTWSRRGRGKGRRGPGMQRREGCATAGLPNAGAGRAPSPGRPVLASCRSHRRGRWDSGRKDRA